MTGKELAVLVACLGLIVVWNTWDGIRGWYEIGLDEIRYRKLLFRTWWRWKTRG